MAPHLADFVHQHKWVDGARMAAGSSRDGDNTVHTRFGRLACMLLVGHIMKNQAAVTVYRFHYLTRCPQRRDDNRHV